MWPCGSLLLFMLCRLSDVTQNQTGTKAQGPNPGSTGPRLNGPTLDPRLSDPTQDQRPLDSLVRSTDPVQPRTKWICWAQAEQSDPESTRRVVWLLIVDLSSVSSVLVRWRADCAAYRPGSLIRANFQFSVNCYKPSVETQCQVSKTPNPGLENTGLATHRRGSVGKWNWFQFRNSMLPIAAKRQSLLLAC